MDKKDCFSLLREVIDTSMATVDENGKPQVRIIDIMYVDSETV